MIFTPLESSSVFHCLLYSIDLSRKDRESLIPVVKIFTQSIPDSERSLIFTLQGCVGNCYLFSVFPKQLLCLLLTIWDVDFVRLIGHYLCALFLTTLCFLIGKDDFKIWLQALLQQKVLSPLALNAYAQDKRSISLYKEVAQEITHKYRS